MAWELIRDAFPGNAASAIRNNELVTLSTGSGDRKVQPIATVNALPLGLSEASAAIGEAVTVYDRGNYVKVTAAASVGAGAEIGPIGATKSLGPIAAASGVVAFSVGQSVSAAAAGEKFTVFVNPRQLGGLA